MHLIVTIDLAGEAFRHGNIGSETARITFGVVVRRHAN